jgi:hypothetical protein
MCENNWADCNSNKQTDGCETDTTQVTNCAGCGNVCDTANSQGRTCSGTTCSYTGCNAGRRNCNTAAPDVAGCECETGQPNPNQCCGAGTTCQTKHSNGLGSFYYDCVQCQGTGPGCTGSWTQAEAMNACLAWVANAGMGGLCNLYSCGGGPLKAVCADAPAPCACWGYNGTPAGHALNDPSCTFCPGASDPLWN